MPAMVELVRNRMKGGNMGCIIGDLKYIIKASNNIANKELKRRQLPVLSSHIIIFHIISTNSILFNELQKQLQYSKSTLSDAINKYEKLGIMEKIECPEDKRNIYISLTADGILILNQLIEIDELIKSQMFADFDSHQIAETEFNVNKMMKNLL